MTKYHESALIEAQILREVNVRERNSRRGSAESSLCVEMFNQLEHQVRACCCGAIYHAVLCVVVILPHMYVGTV